MEHVLVGVVKSRRHEGLAQVADLDPCCRKIRCCPAGKQALDAAAPQHEGCGLVGTPCADEDVVGRECDGLAVGCRRLH